MIIIPAKGFNRIGPVLSYTVATTLKRKSVCVKSLKAYLLSEIVILLTSDELNRFSFSKASIVTRYFFDTPII